jgi:hypothetical protein
MVNQCCREGAAVVFDCEKWGRRASSTGPAVLNPSSARRETQQAGLRLGEANMGVRVPPGSGIVPQSATFDSGTVKFQYYNDGGPWDGGGSPSTFSVPGNAKFYTHFTVTVSGNQIIFHYLHKTRWERSPKTSLESNGLYINNGALISRVTLIPRFTNVTLDPSSSTGDAPRFVSGEHLRRRPPAGFFFAIEITPSFWPLSLTTNAAPVSSIDQGGGKRRGGIIHVWGRSTTQTPLTMSRHTRPKSGSRSRPMSRAPKS